MRIAAYLAPKTLVQLRNRLDADARLQSAWHRAAPARLAGAVTPVRIQDGTLILHTPSSAWASRVRHQQVTLLARLQEDGEFATVERLSIRVQPPAPVLERRRPRRREPRLSAAGRAAIEGAAEGVSDRGLKAALRRLARRR